MPRRREVPKRELLPDPVYGNTLVTKFVNTVMKGGKRSTAEAIIYRAFDIIKDKTGDVLTGDALFNHQLTQINVADPKTFIGLLIGGSVAFLFSSLAIRAVSRTAGTIVPSSAKTEVFPSLRPITPTLITS